jgi:hypothetical protein
MDGVEAQRARLRVGTRVPAHTEGKKFDYLDVGMNIECQAKSNMDVAWLREDQLWIDVNAEATSFALDANGKANYSARNRVMQSIRTAMTTVVPLGKPIVISTVDNPDSNRTFKLTVAATLIK